MRQNTGKSVAEPGIIAASARLRYRFVVGGARKAF
jgi:hypothetical protein